MKRQKEKGVALVLSLIVVSVLSVLAVTFIFLSQSETWSTLNYRLTSQARDGAEAGINAAVNYIVNTYTPPTSAAACGADTLSCYNMTVYPTVWASNGAKTVGLSGTGSSAPSSLAYPISAVQTGFNTSGVGYGSISAGSTTVNYASYAQLLAMRQVSVFGGTQATVQTWRIVTDATIDTGVRKAKEQLTMILDKPIVPTWGYAAFATSNLCSALTFSQAGTTTKSYDSQVAGGPAASTQNANGSVGTNGNLTISSNATIYGSLSTPASGTGTCVNGVGGASTAETACGGCTVSGGIVELPQAITYPPPALPSPMPGLTSQTTNSTCASGNIPNCTELINKKITLHPGTYDNVSLGSAMTDVHFVAGTYNMNSFSSGNVNVVIDSGPVIINVTGCATKNVGNTDCATYMTTAADFSSSGISNSTYNPLNFQIQYAGPNTIAAKCGNTAVSALVYAPNGSVNLTANGSFYGAVIGKDVTVASGATLYYDRNLKSNGLSTGAYMLSGFNWAKY